MVFKQSTNKNAEKEKAHYVRQPRNEKYTSAQRWPADLHLKSRERRPQYPRKIKASSAPIASAKASCSTSP
jgi:hypothetical protein